MDKVKNVLSSKSVVEKAADAAIKGLDAVWYTAEEKVGDRQKRMDQALKFVELTKGASPARRNIAMVVIFMWAIIGLNILFLMNLSAFVEPNVVVAGDDVTVDVIVRIDGAIDRLTAFSIDYVAKPTGLVLAFYFLKNILPSR